MWTSARRCKWHLVSSVLFLALLVGPWAVTEEMLIEAGPQPLLCCSASAWRHVPFGKLRIEPSGCLWKENYESAPRTAYNFLLLCWRRWLGRARTASWALSGLCWGVLLAVYFWGFTWDWGSDVGTSLQLSPASPGVQLTLCAFTSSWTSEFRFRWWPATERVTLCPLGQH